MASLEALFKPKTVALIGATDSRATGWSQRLYDNLVYSKPDTEIYLINPRRTELWGRKVYASFEEIGRQIDLGLCVVPTEHVLTTIRDGAENKLKAAIIYSAQFGEGNDLEGHARADALLELKVHHGIRLCGPNCMGALSLHERMLFYPAPRIRIVQPGEVGVVFQSGGTFQYWLQQATTRGIGFSYAVSSGNELDLGIADYINFLVDDERTRVIVCLIEGIHREADFKTAAKRALEAGKPILIVKGGSSEKGRAAALSHTGALAGDDDVFNALCLAYGIIRCGSLDELLETCLAFCHARLPKRGKTAIVTYSGSSKGLMFDYVDQYSLDLAEFTAGTVDALKTIIDPGLEVSNPIDAGATIATQPKKFAELCKLVARDENVGLLVIQSTLPVNEYDSYDATHLATLAGCTDKPILAWSRTHHNVSSDALLFQKEAGIPFIQGMPQSIIAAAALHKYVNAKSRGAKEPIIVNAGDPIETSDVEKELITSGLKIPRSFFCKTTEDAISSAYDLYPLALKINSSQPLHKTELGGVTLNIKNAEELKAASTSMQAALEKANIPFEGFLIQEMMTGLEMILGARIDAVYGPIVMIGMGGVTAEVLNDRQIRMLPLGQHEPEEMLSKLRGAPLLGSFRNQKPRDIEALCDAVHHFSEVFLKHVGTITDMEINPLMVGAEGDGTVMVDLRIVSTALNLSNSHQITGGR